MSSTLLPGFADPVIGAQACFRSILAAMSRPGSIHTAGDGLIVPPPPAPATGAVLLSLIDSDTPIWIDDAAERAREWIAFHCGALTAPAEGCAFALAMQLPDFRSLPAGLDETPESSATLILQVTGFSNGRTYRLEGPGLKEPALFTAEGLPAGFAQVWQANHALFPRGVDMILCAGTQLAALPRSVALQEV
jgi:alpha-D-ribose 1-methylphosphonate 5-triphosphate synthase subunit PhnH